MKTIAADENLVAFCGLYCGACTRYLKGKCPGCRENVKAAWCGVRSCCIANRYRNCADCAAFEDVNECGKFNNFFSRIFALVLRSDRKACIEALRRVGPAAFAHAMAEKGTQTIRK